MEQPDVEVRFAHEFLGKSGRVRVTVTTGHQVFVDEFKLTSERARSLFTGKVTSRFGALDELTVANELDRIVAAYDATQRARVDSDDGDDRSSGSSADSSQAEVLLELVINRLGVELFRAEGGSDCHAYARARVGDHVENFSLTGRTFRYWLIKNYHEHVGGVPNGSALTDAINSLVGKALFEGPVHPVSVRIAGDNTASFIDLGRDDHQLVTITGDGWHVVASADAPVRFVRRDGMLEMPIPTRGGSFEPLRRLLNVPRDSDWVLLLGYLVMCMRPTGPFPILVVNGEQGSAKSSLCRIARRLVDPNASPLRRPPKDERDLVIAAKNSRTLAFDNLSGISPSIADALCALATGSGFTTRKLYSDDEEALFSSQRPILINGIDDLATRPDLLDRSIVLRLEAIPDEVRREECDIEAELKTVLPSVFGALCDAMSVAIARRDAVHHHRVPRMADFARCVLAAEPAFHLTSVSFMQAYLENRADVNADILQAAAVAVAISEMMAHLSTWEGSATQLLASLNKALDPELDFVPSWPRNPSALAAQLARLAPSLRSKGLVVETGRRRAGGSRDRFLRITKLEGAKSGVSPPSPVGSPGSPADVDSTDLRGPGAADQEVPHD